MTAGAVLIFCAAASLLALVRLVRGPGMLDRALAARAALTLAALAAAAAAVARDDAAALDVALGLGFVAAALALAVFKALRHRSLQPPMAALKAQRPPLQTEEPAA